MNDKFHPTGITDDARLFDSLKRIADAMIQLLGKSFEITIHDFQDLTSSLVYLQGEVTGRKLGAPVSPSLYALLKEHGHAIQDRINYRTKLRGGRIVRSTTTFIRDEQGRAAGCFCMNHDVTDLLNMRDLLNTYSELDGEGGGKVLDVPEISSTDFINQVVRQAAADRGKQPAFMNKDERLALVRMLEKNGIFRLKGAVEHTAGVLGVTRYTIYNYLKQISAEHNSFSRCGSR